MSISTSIGTILKHYAIKQNSPIIDYDDFCDYLKKYSEYNLEEQPSLMMYLSNIKDALRTELEKLEDSHQIMITEVAPGKKVISVVSILISRFSNRYKEFSDSISLQFPSEEDLPKKTPSTVVNRVNAHELLKRLLENEELSDKYLYGVMLPHDTPMFIMPSNVPIITLIEICLSKIRNLLNKEDHHDFFLKKLSVSNPGRELSAKNFFNKFADNPENGITMLKQAGDNFYLWNQLCYFIKQDYEKVKDIAQEDKSILQSVLITEIAANYFKNKSQIDAQRENALKLLENNLQKPPYYYSFEEILKFTDTKGVPLLGQYTENDLKAFLTEKTTEGKLNQLPPVLVFKTEDGKKYFIFKDKVVGLIVRLCTDARLIIKDTIQKHWSEVLKEYNILSEMNDQKAFEKRLEKEVMIQYPVLYALLNSTFLSLIQYETVGETANKSINLFDNGKILPYSELLLTNRAEILTDAKMTLPFWYTIPFLAAIIRFLRDAPKRRRQKLEKQQKTYSQLYHEQEAITAKQDEELSEISQNPLLNKKLALREAARTAEAALVPDSSTLDRELDSYKRQWNKLIGKESNNNLTEDVNALIRDYMRKVMKSIKSNGFTLDRIHSLAQSLVNTPSLQKIGEQDSLLMYTQLYMIKIVKNIQI